jgi:hypothetical protein
MTKREVVKALKEYDPDTEVILYLDAGKKGLVEECSVRAEFEGYGVGFLASTMWRFSKLKSTEMTVGDVLKTLKKKLDKMTEKDFVGVYNEESSDGSTEFSDVTWDDVTPTDVREQASLWDLYYSGDIDCECTFQGLDSLEIDVDGTVYQLNEE